MIIFTFLKNCLLSSERLMIALFLLAVFRLKNNNNLSQSFQPIAYIFFQKCPNAQDILLSYLLKEFSPRTL